jgi:hypothetical protein
MTTKKLVLHLLQSLARSSHTTPRSEAHEFSLLGALLPLHVDNLREFEIGRIGSEQTKGLGVRRGQADLGVDVEQALSATRRPNNRGAVGFIMFEVVAG